LTDTLSLKLLLDTFEPGDEWTWQEEFEWLEANHLDRLVQLAMDIQMFGIEEPILLGNDWRVWDGHHRLCVARHLDMAYVPVEYVS